MSYKRYKAALIAIADGSADPVGIAKEALCVPHLRKTWAEHRASFEPKRIEFFQTWIDAGRPTYAAIGKRYGITPTAVGVRLFKAAVSLLKDKNHPLHAEAHEFRERYLRRSEMLAHHHLPYEYPRRFG